MTDRVLGIRVSEINKTINWKQIGNNVIQFGFAHATKGVSKFDKKFDANWLGLRNRGMIRGAIHLFDPKESAMKQADFFLNHVSDILHKSDLPPVLYIDVNQRDLYQNYYSVNTKSRIEGIQSWLLQIENVVGEKPIILTNRNTWQYTLGNPTSFSEYPLWIQDVNQGKPTVFCDDWQGNSWCFWEFNHQASVNGVNNGQARVAMSLFNGKMIDLKEMAGFEKARPILDEMSIGQFSSALFATADDLRVSPLNFLDQCESRYLIQSYEFRNRIYNGLDISEMNLTSEEANTFRNQIVQVLSHSQFYLEDMTNQDMINAIYGAAMIMNLNGWTLLEKAGLTALLKNPTASYEGPTIEDLPLTAEEQVYVFEVLGVKTKDELIRSDVIPTYEASVTNQDILNCIYQAAIILNMQGWQLLKKTGLSSIIFNRVKVYTGPKVEAMKDLDTNEKSVLQEEIAQLIAFGEKETYEGLINQDMVNIFYAAATNLNTSGWSLLKKAKIESIANDKTIRYEGYCGPKIEKLESLTNEEIQVLIEAKKKYLLV